MLYLREDGFMFDIYDWEPYEFWGYTTYITDRIVSLESGLMGIRETEEILLKYFQEKGIPAVHDNKIAFGLKRGFGRLIYVGFYDGSMTIGLGVQPDDGLKPIRNPNS